LRYGVDVEVSQHCFGEAGVAVLGKVADSIQPIRVVPSLAPVRIGGAIKVEGVVLGVVDSL
jgi:hypothetical protein